MSGGYYHKLRIKWGRTLVLRKVRISGIPVCMPLRHTTRHPDGSKMISMDVDGISIDAASKMKKWTNSYLDMGPYQFGLPIVSSSCYSRCQQGAKYYWRLLDNGLTSCSALSAARPSTMAIRDDRYLLALVWRVIRVSQLACWRYPDPILPLWGRFVVKIYKNR